MYTDNFTSVTSVSEKSITLQTATLSGTGEWFNISIYGIEGVIEDNPDKQFDFSMLVTDLILMQLVNFGKIFVSLNHSHVNIHF